jgi:hypothetical protein
MQSEERNIPANRSSARILVILISQLIAKLEVHNLEVSFSISFPDQPLEYLGDDPAIPSAIGLLVLGDFQESFASTLYEWKQSDYENQWREAISSLLDGTEKVALMVCYVNAGESDNFEWWPMYRVGDMVALQNHMPWHDQFAEPFSLERQFEFVRDRRTANEEGQQISEWSIALESVREFAVAKGWISPA